MPKTCELCEFLKDPQHQILATKHWNIGTSNNQAYLGRAFMTLRRHKGSLSALSEEEWQDFRRIVGVLEKAYKQAFGAEPLNWGCFMNIAFQTEPHNPHVHWHIFPRYKVAPVVAGITFSDKRFGYFYDDKAEHIVSDEVVRVIVAQLKKAIGQQTLDAV